MKQGIDYKMNAKLINPLSIYTFSWILVLLVYLMDWSYLYPKLTWEVLSFLFVTSVISLFLSNRYYFRYSLQYVEMGNVSEKVIKKVLYILYVLLILEFVYAKQIPILSYTGGMADDGDYMKFGIPTVKVVVVNGFSLVFLFCVSLLFFGNIKKKKIALLCFFSILPPILCMQRGITLNMLFGGLCIALLQSRNLKKNLIKTAIFGAFLLIIFGVMGQLRHSDKDLIVNIAQPKPSYEKMHYPNGYMWSYLYISSPLADLQYCVNHDADELDYGGKSGFIPFVFVNIVPDFIHKYFIERPDVSRFYVHPSLVVGSTYMLPFCQLGFLGLILMFVYIMFFLIVCIKIVPRYSPFYPPLVAILCEMSLFGMFDNMVGYGGMFPQLILIYLGNRYIFKKKQI